MGDTSAAVGSAVTPAPPPIPALPHLTPDRHPIIVLDATSGRTPAGSPAASWLADAARRVPLGRWDADDARTAKAAACFAACVAEVEAFDAGLFGMAPAEAVSTDAGQRLLLEARNEGNWGGGRWGWRPRLAGAHGR